MAIKGHHSGKKPIDSVSDNTLMLTIQAGDVDKLGVLFERHKNRLFGYFYMRTKDRQTSEDLVQNVFYRILKYRSRFEGHGEFSSWMYRIARNACADYLNKNRRYVYEDTAILEKGQENSSPEQSFLDNERTQILNRALDLLKQDQKEVLVLSRYQGLKYQEIGDILGCPESTVKVRVFRAMKMLKEIVSRLESETS
jgi:RNA polymerase sigma factor (sigma-70 family)